MDFSSSISAAVFALFIGCQRCIHQIQDTFIYVGYLWHLIRISWDPSCSFVPRLVNIFLICCGLFPLHPYTPHRQNRQIANNNAETASSQDTSTDVDDVDDASGGAATDRWWGRRPFVPLPLSLSVAHTHLPTLSLSLRIYFRTILIEFDFEWNIKRPSKGRW